jgi:hypothetical protein
MERKFADLPNETFINKKNKRRNLEIKIYRGKKSCKCVSHGHQAQVKKGETLFFSSKCVTSSSSSSSNHQSRTLHQKNIVNKNFIVFLLSFVNLLLLTRLFFHFQQS